MRTLVLSFVLVVASCSGAEAEETQISVPGSIQQSINPAAYSPAVHYALQQLIHERGSASIDRLLRVDERGLFVQLRDGDGGLHNYYVGPGDVHAWHAAHAAAHRPAAPDYEAMIQIAADLYFRDASAPKHLPNERDSALFALER